MMQVRRFAIIEVSLDPTIGSEVKKTRPCIVVSPNEINDLLDTVMIVPLTSKKKGLPTRVKISKTASLSKDSYAMLDQIRTISKSRIVNDLGFVSNKVGEEILSVLKEIFEL